MSRSPPNAPPTPPLGPFTRRSRHRRPRSPLHPPEISHSQGRRREVPRRAGHPPFAGDVVLGLWVAAQAGDGDAVNGRVDLAVAAAVEVVAVGLARARIAATPAARPSLASRADLPAPAISPTSLAPANGLKPGSHSSCGVAVSPDARWPPRRRRRRRKPAWSEPAAGPRPAAHRPRRLPARESRSRKIDAAGAREFLFVALPLAIRGATGSMVDPSRSPEAGARDTSRSARCRSCTAACRRRNPAAASGAVMAPDVGRCGLMA